MPDADERDAERTVLRLLGSVIAFLLAAGVLSVAQGMEETAAPVTGLAPEPPRDALGPAPGERLPAYAAARAAALREADGSRVAVVSLSAYRSEQEARTLLGDVEVRQLLVAAPGRPPVAVEDVGAWVAGEREAVASERAELERLIPTVDDPAFADQYRVDLARLGVVQTELTATGAVVFGAVVVADAGVLRDLRGAAGVRLVDVAPSDEVPPVVRGLRPEETAAAGLPPERPLPA